MKLKTIKVGNDVNFYSNNRMKRKLRYLFRRLKSSRKELLLFQKELSASLLYSLQIDQLPLFFLMIVIIVIKIATRKVMLKNEGAVTFP